MGRSSSSVSLTALGGLVGSLSVVCLERLSPAGVFGTTISPALAEMLRAVGCGAGGRARGSVRGPSPGGGEELSHGFPSGFPKSIKTREKLSEYLTVVIFTASAQHAAVNFGQVSWTRGTLRAGTRSESLHPLLAGEAGPTFASSSALGTVFSSWP